MVTDAIFPSWGCGSKRPWTFVLICNLMGSLKQNDCKTEWVISGYLLDYNNSQDDGWTSTEYIWTFRASASRRAASVHYNTTIMQSAPTSHVLAHMLSWDVDMKSQKIVLVLYLSHNPLAMAQTSCASAKSRQRFRCSHTLSRNIDEGSDKLLVL